MLAIIQLLVLDAMYVSQGGITISGLDDVYQYRCEEPGLTSRSDQLLGAPD